MKGKIFTAIGLMSGTSCDGIDASILKTDGENFVEFGESVYLKYSKKFRLELLELIKGNYQNLFNIETEIAELHASVVEKLLNKAKLDKTDIDIIGFHGQTILHAPANAITKQIGNAQLLAALTGIDVVYDLRKNDVVNGGQGAPLIPIFHKALASNIDQPTCFVNIGGVSNVTYISGDSLTGFDCGTGSALINDFCEKHFNVTYDKDGAIAAKGTANALLLKEWLAHPFFKIKDRKSLDRMEFVKLTADAYQLNANDAVATLTEFTACGIAQTINYLKPSRVYLCGGGRKNKTLVKMIESKVNINTSVEMVDSLGVDGDFIESYGWGYLAVRSMKGLAITFPQTTGCKVPLTGGVLAKKTDFIPKASNKPASKFKLENK